MTKIAIRLPDDAPTQEETLWAERLGKNLFRLDNTPWYAHGCALDDVITCEEEDGKVPRFVRVVRPSGNRTVRVFVPETSARSAVKSQVFKVFDETGCFYEEYGSDKGLIAATIPYSIDAAPVLEKLRDMQAAGTAYWESGNF